MASPQANAESVEFLSIDHIQLAIPAGAEEVAKRFYSGVLGLTAVEKPEYLRARGGCWFAGNNVRVHLGVDQSFVPARKAHPAFLVSSIGVLKRALERAGVEITWDTQLAGYERFYVVDPFGNRLEFMQQSS